MAACCATTAEEEKKTDERKRLFNYKPLGKRLPDFKDLENKPPTGKPSYLLEIRSEMQKHMAPLKELGMFKDAMEKSEITKFTVKKGDISDGDIPVFMTRPKSLPAKGCSAVIFVHGGGCVVGDAEMFLPIYAFFSLHYGVVGFNVDYRLAPEHRNKGGSDVYAAVKHIYDNADELGIDKTRIALEGSSGGAHHVLNACNLMARKGDTGMIKMILFEIPMLNSLVKYTPKDDLPLKEERAYKDFCDFLNQCLTGDDWKDHVERKDPMLFPELVDDKFLKDYPPCAFFSAEFCMYNSAAVKFSQRLEKLGKLLEFRLIRGLGHMYAMSTNEETNQVFVDRVTCINVYLKK